VEASFRALSGGPGALPAGGPKPLAAGRPEAGRYADTGRLLSTCPDQPGIVAAVSSYLFASGANITESMRWKMTRASELKRVAIMVSRAGQADLVVLADRVIGHQNKTIVFT
jgi:formyltetrahydrofolate hydrolase